MRLINLWSLPIKPKIGREALFLPQSVESMYTTHRSKRHLDFRQKNGGMAESLIVHLQEEQISAPSICWVAQVCL